MKSLFRADVSSMYAGRVFTCKKSIQVILPSGLALGTKSDTPKRATLRGNLQGRYRIAARLFLR
jgi:hypothetical protein